MLLDLNVGIISGDSVCDGTGSVMEAPAAEESPTSTSSVVSAEDVRNNAAEVDSSSTDTSPLVFDVFKKETETRVVNAAPEFVTRQLFPFSGEGVVGSSAPAKTQWLNLSFSDKIGVGQTELRIVQQKQQQVRKSRRGPRSRSSQYRGVTFYRRTGRWESHIWDCGKQVYLGGFDTAHSAARAYDRAAIKFRGIEADINFSLVDYEEDMKQTQNLSKEEFVLTLRRQSTGFARGNSKYRAAGLHKLGPLVARNGQFLGKMVYDKGAIQYIKKEVTANLEPGAYEGEIVVPANSGNCQNLDLSLGMSLTSNGQKGNDNAKEFHFQYAAGDMLTRDGKLNVSLAGESLNGLPVATKHSWPGLYPGFFPAREGRSTEMKVEAVTSPRVGNWGWHSNAVPAYSNSSSSAASSGFASSTTTTNQQQNNVVVRSQLYHHPIFTTPSSNAQYPSVYPS